MFGQLKVKKSFKGEHFSVSKGKDFCKYKRGKKEVKIVGKNLTLEILPLAPVHLPEKITEFFSVSFPKIHMSPRGKVIVFLKVPMEVGVFLEGEPIDIFGFEKEEFSLYGPVDGGIITRQVAGEEVSDKIQGDGKSLIIPLRIKNYTGELKTVSKLILDTKFLDIYYKKKQAATEMVKLDIREVPRVRYLNKNYFKGMEKRRAKRQILKKEDIVEMKWGV